MSCANFNVFWQFYLIVELTRCIRMFKLLAWKLSKFRSGHFSACSQLYLTYVLRMLRHWASSLKKNWVMFNFVYLYRSRLIPSHTITSYEKVPHRAAVRLDPANYHRITLFLTHFWWRCHCGAKYFKSLIIKIIV